MEKTVTIPLKEYTELVENYEALKKALSKKNSCIIKQERIPYPPTGFQLTYTIYSNDEAVSSLMEQIKKLSGQKNQNYNEKMKLLIEIADLKKEIRQLKEKRWWSI